MSTLRNAADNADVATDFADDDLLDAVFTAMDAVRGLLISGWQRPARQRHARWCWARERLRQLFPPPEKVVAAAVSRVIADVRD
jgi:hypothetical protein